MTERDDPRVVHRLRNAGKIGVPCQACDRLMWIFPSEEGKILTCSWKCRLARMQRTLAERFWEKVIIRQNGCWGWRGAISAGGYGHLSKGKRGAGHIRAHVLSYELHHGPVPLGKQVLHTCDNKTCSRPDHLYAGTRKNNAQDAYERGLITPPSLPGESNPAARLTATQVIAIRADKRPIAVIARDYGVGWTTIKDIKRRRTWHAI